MGKDRRAEQQLQSQLVNTFTVLVCAYILRYNINYLNPWSLTLGQWISFFVFIRCAITFYDHLVIYVIDHWIKAPLLPTRTQPKAVRRVDLDVPSIIFLSFNAVNECVFVQRLCHYIYYSSSVPRLPEDVGLLNTLGALYVMFVVNDLMYAPLHHILHLPAMYPLVHKHHHRQHYPVRGYLDAGNEHPIEHAIGVCCTWAAVLSAVFVTGAHAVTVFFFFNIHAALAMLNHSPYDVKFCIPYTGLEYSVGNHEMHHRKFTVNYAQYVMWYDTKMANTFAEYEGPSPPKKLS
mmetsp:Transcript_18200/g.27194  ORF Transcript_18200/g.27194 Transcript_18200/m.27194 type:complete len:291 (-) Transcript_18200:571-1443(-)